MSKQQYFLHATPESSSEKIKSDGFLYVKWRPTVTWSLRLAVFHATEQWYVEKPETKWELWNILCLELPDQKNIKTSVKWNIWVDYKKRKFMVNQIFGCDEKLNEQFTTSEFTIKEKEYCK